MLLACRACHRVYDVKGLAVGKKVRCACGSVNEVSKPASIERAMAHCGSCGGALTLGAKECSYCQARVTLLEEKLGDPCPHCLTRIPSGARFCSSCGRPVTPEAVLQPLANADCPVCTERLNVVEGGSDPFHQCSSCGGLWLSQEALDAFVEEMKERPSTPAERRTVSQTVRIGRRVKAGHLGHKCPVCRTAMFRHEFARYSGVCVDRCRAHGWWFDCEELERIGTFVRAEGLQQADLRDRSRIHSRSRARLWRARIAAENGQSSLLGAILDQMFD